MKVNFNKVNRIIITDANNKLVDSFVWLAVSQDGDVLRIKKVHSDDEKK